MRELVGWLSHLRETYLAVFTGEPLNPVFLRSSLCIIRLSRGDSSDLQSIHQLWKLRAPECSPTFPLFTVAPPSPHPMGVLGVHLPRDPVLSLLQGQALLFYPAEGTTADGGEGIE